MFVAIPPPQYVFMVWCLVKHSDNLIFSNNLIAFEYNWGGVLVKIVIEIRVS
jgi:hypothetical protein